MNHDYLIEEAAKIYKILGNKVRIHILLFLRDHQDSAVSEIVDHMRLSQPVISKQLGILAKYNLVQSRKEGQHVFYSVKDQDVVQMIDAMTEHIGHMKKA